MKVYRLSLIRWYLVMGGSYFISITFLTVCEAIQLPAVARESVATMIPPLNLKARVVVP